MERPNVVLLVLDAVRADHVSAYGYERPTTPNVDALADDGVVYENAFANSNWTGTSHASLFTGRMPSDTGVHGGNQVLPADSSTLPERLKAAGYSTFAMSAGAHVRAERGYDRGVDTFKETYRISPSRDFASGVLRDPALRRQAAFSTTRGPDKKTLYKFESLKQWIETEEDPFFAFINAKTAHHPYNPPRPHKSRFCADLERPRYQFVEELFGDDRGERQSLPEFDWDRLQRLSYEYPVLASEFEPTEAEWDVVKSWYDGAIHYMDRRIGELVDWLRERDQLEDTYLIVTADHGEYFGEHGLEKHYYGLYEPVLHVPLLIYGPDTTGSISAPVTLADLYPTIVDLSGEEPPSLPHAQSLLPWGDVDREYTFAELGAVSPSGILGHHPDFEETGLGNPTQVVRGEEFKLVHQQDSAPELYRWRVDPDETSEVGEDHPDVVEELRGVVDSELGTLSDERLDEDVDDERLEEHLRDLGYM